MEDMETAEPDSTTVNSKVTSSFFPSYSLLLAAPFSTGSSVPYLIAGRKTLEAYRSAFWISGSVLGPDPDIFGNALFTCVYVFYSHVV
jgi:hypothetical protein